MNLTFLSSSTINAVRYTGLFVLFLFGSPFMLNSCASHPLFRFSFVGNVKFVATSSWNSCLHTPFQLNSIIRYGYVRRSIGDCNTKPWMFFAPQLSMSYQVTASGLAVRCSAFIKLEILTVLAIRFQRRTFLFFAVKSEELDTGIITTIGVRRSEPEDMSHQILGLACKVLSRARHYKSREKCHKCKLTFIFLCSPLFHLTKYLSILAPGS